MFEDESVTITQTIQNIKDISKVFTDFSRTFSVPASKTNNKIFRHYYNSDIANGFDARTKKNANIELNNTPFRTGKIKLEGVDLKNNQPHTYRVTFFGSTVTLKDLLGEDKLNDLIEDDELGQYNLDYNATQVRLKLAIAPSSTNHVIVPLITHTQRLFYDSVTHTKGDGNLYFHSGNGQGNQLHGVKWNELKYALRVNKIIEAIEAKYTIANGYNSDLIFSDDFFKNINVEEFNNLFLWLHRKSGAVENLSGNDVITTLVDGFTPSYQTIYVMRPATLIIPVGQDSFNKLELRLNTTSNVSYNISVTKNNNEVFSLSNIIGNFYANFNIYNWLTDGSYQIFITAESAITFSNILWDLDTVNNGIYQFTTGVFTTSASFVFNVSNQMPEIKIIDLLSGLFKTFNLTAYVENGIIKVETLDNFYESGKGADNLTEAYDITKYIDVNTSSVDVPLIYNDILFKFKDTKTFLANKFGELNNRAWGESTAIIENNEIKLSGSQYKIEVPFGKMLFEKLTDQSDGSPKDIQWGWNVDKSQNAYLGSPLLFYPINTSTGQISFVDVIDDDGVPTSRTAITTANLPFNSVSKVAATNSSQLSFFNEQNEWTLNSDFDGTLYKDYYNEYITNVFDVGSRLKKVTAYLPLRILVNYNLSDRFVISGNKYKINSITTNLQTGKSDIELLNDFYLDTINPSPPTNLVQTGSTSSSITFSWTESTDNEGVEGYKIYLNNIFVGTSATPPKSLGGLSSSTAYLVRLVAYDYSGNESISTSNLTMFTSS